MKNIYKILTLALTLTIFTSCERDQGDYAYLDNREITIGFRGASASLFVENGASNVVSASIGASTIVSSDATFSVSVDDSSTAVLGVDFDFASGQDGTLMSGNLLTTIDIIADFDNSVVEGKSVVLNLTSNDPSLLVSEAFSQYTITLFQYCPFDGLNTTSYTAYPSAFGSDAPEYSVVLTPVGISTTEYTIASGWGPNFVSWATGNPAYDGQYQYSGTITINEDFTIDFVGDDPWATGGFGEFSPCTQEFSYTLSQGLFTTAFDTNVVLLPN
jgi:hypothetical protein